MTPLEKAAYITKFFQQLDDASNGHIQADFDLPTLTFTMRVYGSEYSCDIAEAQMFVIGWNVCKTHHNNKNET